MSDTPKEPAEEHAAGPKSLPELTFEEHKEQTALDCEQIVTELQVLVVKVRSGNMNAFEQWWFQGGTEEGDAKISALREIILLRYFHRQERLKD